MNNTLNTPRVAQVLDRLFADVAATGPALEAFAAAPDTPAMLSSKTRYRELYARLKDIPIPVSRETGLLLYMLARSSGAKSIVEFGTSFGVSTIYLAAALRDNGGSGRIITTEFEPSKAARARANFAAAGLDDLVEVREGDALETLRDDLPETLDLVLLDGAKGLYADIFNLLEARLRSGSVLLADDANHCPEFVQRLRSDAELYVSVPLKEDLEVALRL